MLSEGINVVERKDGEVLLIVVVLVAAKDPHSGEAEGKDQRTD